MVDRRSDFRVVISEWLSTELPSIIEREVKIPLKPSLIPTIIGPRRAGKTYLMFHTIKRLLEEEKVRKENILYVNFEHERLKDLEARNLEEMIEVYYQLAHPKGEIYLFLDEIQKVKDWELWVRKIYDFKKFRIFITGSSSKLLSREISTALRGRSIDFLIFPFSFKEFLRVKNFRFENLNLLALTSERGKILHLLEEYLVFGGFPEVVIEENRNVKIRILRGYYNTIFYKDLVERFNVENFSLLDTFLKFCLSNFSKYFSISSTYNFIKSIGLECSKQTLSDYSKYAEEILFLFQIPILARSHKTQKQYPKKIYVVDNGFISSLYPELVSFGRLMENLVAVELIRRSELFSNFSVYYWKEYGKREGKEIDFIIKEGLRIKQLIQVTYASNKDEMNQREIKALEKAYELFKKDRPELLIITWDYEDILKKDNLEIKCVPLWKWLLSA